MGYEALNALENYTIDRGDGVSYRIDETIFKAPDHTHIVGIERHDGMAPLGEIHPDTQLGGPAYVSQVVQNMDDTLRFYVDVLGMAVRIDEVWTSNGSESALAVPPGTQFRFALVYAPDTTSQHVVLLQYLNCQTQPSAQCPRPPNQGIVGWSFRVADVAKTLERRPCQDDAHPSSVTVYDCPVLGRIKAAVLTDPKRAAHRSLASHPDDSPPSLISGQLNPGAAQLYGQYLAGTVPLMAAHDAHVLAVGAGISDVGVTQTWPINGILGFKS